MVPVLNCIVKVVKQFCRGGGEEVVGTQPLYIDHCFRQHNHPSPVLCPKDHGIKDILTLTKDNPSIHTPYKITSLQRTI